MDFVVIEDIERWRGRDLMKIDSAVVILGKYSDKINMLVKARHVFIVSLDYEAMSGIYNPKHTYLYNSSIIYNNSLFIGTSDPNWLKEYLNKIIISSQRIIIFLKYDVPFTHNTNLTADIIVYKGPPLASDASHPRGP